MSEPPFAAPDEHEVEFQISVPPDLEGGVYANFLSIWHSAYEFTLDFASTLPAQAPQEGEEAAPIRVPCRVVSRVKIPVTVVFDILRALNENMTRYEQAFGPISPPAPRREEES